MMRVSFVFLVRGLSCQFVSFLFYISCVEVSNVFWLIMCHMRTEDYREQTPTHKYTHTYICARMLRTRVLCAFNHPEYLTSDFAEDCIHIKASASILDDLFEREPGNPCLLLHFSKRVGLIFKF